jgi:hypothetical protein
MNEFQVIRLNLEFGLSYLAPVCSLGYPANRHRADPAVSGPCSSDIDWLQEWMRLTATGYLVDSAPEFFSTASNEVTKALPIGSSI